MQGRSSVSVLLPTRRGGALCEQVIRRVREQRTERPVEVVAVDSGSSPDELAAMKRAGARVESIDPASFDHGLTRDLAAQRSTGDLLVFLNQDALPVGDDWLEQLLAPFDSADPPAAVQGAIHEFPLAELAARGRRRFFWESCGARFYFTGESREWIGRNGGIGFSTVHCAIARTAWQAVPFGPAAILEDKRWQAAAIARGMRIDTAPEAVVWHTHDYGLRDLARRCASEGYGWRGVGVRYRWRDAWRDVRRAADWPEWRRGLRSGEMRRLGEVLFPLVRPLALWWGSRWGRRSWC